jgi:hypothetical protein
MAGRIDSPLSLADEGVAARTAATAPVAARVGTVSATVSLRMGVEDIGRLPLSISAILTGWGCYGGGGALPAGVARIPQPATRG